MLGRHSLKLQINSIPLIAFPVVWNDEHYGLYQQLSTIVCNYHFDGYKNCKEELIEEGIIKIVSLIQEVNYKKEYSFYNYLYTGCRNSMSNYLYHFNKLHPVSDDYLLNTVETENTAADIPNALIDNPSLEHILWNIFRDSEMVNVFDFESCEEQKTFIALIAQRMGLDLSSFTDNNNQEILLALLHFFTGSALRVPSESITVKYRAKAKVFTLYHRGKSLEQISDLMKMPQSKIKKMLREVLLKIEEREVEDVPEKYSQIMANA